MRGLKIAQFTWILVGNGSHAYKVLWAPPEFSEILTFLAEKTISKSASRNYII